MLQNNSNDLIQTASSYTLAYSVHAMHAYAWYYVHASINIQLQTVHGMAK